MTRRLQEERGSGAAELALLTPALVALLMVTVLAFRVTQADAEVADVAAEAARAASLERTPAAAAGAARAAAAANLAAGGITCTNLTVTTDTGAFTAGGVVTVDVTCAVDLTDLLIVNVPATRTLTATGREVVDRYRGAGT